MSTMQDEFGFEIAPGDVFLRIEDKVGGARLRYYFFAGFCDDDKHKIHVQEQNGVPRTILKPSQYQSRLIRLSPDQIKAIGFESLEIEAVRNPPRAKKKGKELII